VATPSPITSTGQDTTSQAPAAYNAPDQAVAFALQQVGKPYAWGTSGPDSFDCSGLIQAAYGSAGVNLPRTTYQQCLIGSPVSGQADAAPGDLVFPYLNESHVCMYIGNGEVVEAPKPGGVVQVVDWYGASGGIRRVTTQVGTGASVQAAGLSTGGTGGPDTSTTGQATSLLSALTNAQDWTSFAYIAAGVLILFVVGAELIGKGL
jgi:uncharacterized protein YycO